jgi:predicted DNA-binding transcriptional regulator AlpA
MENITFTLLTADDISRAIRKELKAILAENGRGTANIETDDIGGIALAMTLTELAQSTIYSLCSKRKIPHSKRGKRLYFSRQELTEWLKQGKRKTQAEITLEAENFGQKNMEAIPSTKTKSLPYKVKNLF